MFCNICQLHRIVTDKFPDSPQNLNEKSLAREEFSALDDEIIENYCYLYSVLQATAYDRRKNTWQSAAHTVRRRTRGAARSLDGRCLRHVPLRLIRLRRQRQHDPRHEPRDNGHGVQRP